MPHLSKPQSESILAASASSPTADIAAGGESARELRLRTARREITERRRITQRLRQALSTGGFVLLYRNRCERPTSRRGIFCWTMPP